MRNTLQLKNARAITITVSTIQLFPILLNLGTKEKYMLLDSEPQFEVIEVDAPVFDEWLNYYTQIEAGIESWSNFLASNDLI
jgi:hypothetical protein